MPFTKRSIWARWKPTNRVELKAFVGVSLNMALNSKAHLKDYFSEDWLDYQPFFKNVFKKDRFLLLFWILHVSPPPSPDAPALGFLTRSSKIRHLMVYLEDAFQKYYIPHEHISVDESTVAFKGRLAFKMYNKDKPTKWGIRVYVLADSSNGYVYAFEPYLGQQTTNNLPRADLPFTSRIVVHLAQKLKNVTQAEGYHIFTDRFYTSCTLAEEMKKMKFDLTGTVMMNRRGLPIEVKQKKLKVGEVIAMHNDYASVLAWKDKRVVHMLSTVYDDSVTNTRRRTGQEVSKPVVVMEYTKHMGGVDLADHYATSYNFNRKTSKWWRKMFFWFLDTAVNNALILYREYIHNNNITSRNFRRQLILELVGSYRNNTNLRGITRNSPHDKPSISDEIRLNNTFHAFGIRKTNNNCRVCSEPNSRKTTCYYCKTCPSQPALHPVDCFEKYHTIRHYR